MHEVIANLLNNENFIRYYKCLALKIGVRETILLQYLISKDEYFQSNTDNYNNWFFNIAIDIYVSTAIPVDSQKRIIDNLIKFNLIETQIIGIPPKKYFKINYIELENTIKESILLKNQLYNELKNKESNSVKSRNHISQNNGDNTVILTESKPLKSGGTNILINNIKQLDNNNKNLCVSPSDITLQNSIKNKRTLKKINKKDIPYIQMIKSLYTFIDNQNINNKIFSRYMLPDENNLLSTNTIIQVIDLFKHIQNNTFKSLPLNKNSMSYFNESELNREFDLQDLQILFKRSIKNFLTYFHLDKWPEKKSTLPGNLLDFIYNKRTGMSWFILCLLRPSDSLSNSILNVNYNKIPESFRNLYSVFYTKHNSMELNQQKEYFQKIMIKLYSWYNKLTKKFEVVQLKSIGYFILTSPEYFANYHIDYLSNKYEGTIHIGHFDPDSASFKEYLKYLYDLDIVLDGAVINNRILWQIQEDENKERNEILNEVKKEIEIYKEFTGDIKFTPSEEEMNNFWNIVCKRLKKEKFLK